MNNKLFFILSQTWLPTKQIYFHILSRYQFIFIYTHFVYLFICYYLFCYLILYIFLIIIIILRCSRIFLVLFKCTGTWQIFKLFSPQCTDKYIKTIYLIAIFLPRVLMYQKCEISLPVGYKTARPKAGDWEWLWRHFRTKLHIYRRQISLTFSYFLINNTFLY